MRKPTAIVVTTCEFITLCIALVLLAHGCSQADGHDAATSQSTQALGEHPGKIRICHFTENDQARILEISERAWQTHLDHGDGFAPPSIHEPEDCQVPHPPTNLVHSTATTDELGQAILAIPESNVRVQVTVQDEQSQPVQGMPVFASAYLEHVLVTVFDQENPEFGPAIAEGNLNDAVPGSSPILKLNLSLLNCIAGAITPLASLPKVLSVGLAHGVIPVIEQCATPDEYEAQLSLICQSGTLAAVAAATQGTALLAACAPIQTQCAIYAAAATSIAYGQNQNPRLVRWYHPPLHPFVWPQVTNTECGGCCIAQGQQCEQLPDQTECEDVGGTFYPRTGCQPNPCCPPTEIFDGTKCRAPTVSVTTTGVPAGWVQSFPTGVSGGIHCGAHAPYPTLGCEDEFNRNASVQLVADPLTAVTGAVFQGWSGDCAGQQLAFTLSMDGDKSCTATFGCPPPTSWDGVRCSRSSVAVEITGSSSCTGNFSADVFVDGEFHSTMTGKPVGPGLHNDAYLELDVDEGASVDIFPTGPSGLSLVYATSEDGDLLECANPARVPIHLTANSNLELSFSFEDTECAWKEGCCPFSLLHWDWPC